MSEECLIACLVLFFSLDVLIIYWVNNMSDLDERMLQILQQRVIIQGLVVSRVERMIHHIRREIWEITIKNHQQTK